MLRKSAGVIAVVAFYSGLLLAQSGDVNAGKLVYEKKCRICHGDNGEGNPDVAKKLNAQQKPLWSDEVKNKSDADLQKIAKEGTGKMKPPKNVSDADAVNVIAYVRTLKAQ